MIGICKRKAKGQQNEGSLLLQNGLPNLSHTLAEEGLFLEMPLMKCVQVHAQNRKKIIK